MSGLFGRVSRLIPRTHSFIEVVDFSKPEFMPNGERLGAASAASAMEEVFPIWVEFAEFLFKVGALKVDLNCAGDVAAGVFLIGPDVDDLRGVILF